MTKRAVLLVTTVLTAFAALTAVASATFFWGHQPKTPKSLLK
jgi:cyclic lactone autoinducer peptide